MIKYINKFKNGFTMYEVLLALTIIGIIIALCMTQFKPYDSAVKYIYINTLTNLDAAFYNALSVKSYNPFDDTDNLGNPIVRNESHDDGTKILCEGLTEYINTNGTINCSAENLTSVLANDSDFTDDKIQFIASNGVRIYMTGRIGSATENFYFYIIFADLNGEKGPNSAKYQTANKAKNLKYIVPDIVPFAVLPIGAVIPIGAAEKDTTFLYTRLVHPAPGRIGEFVYRQPSQPLYVSKAEAWGYYSGLLGLKDDEFDFNEPLSYTGKVRSLINANSLILKDGDSPNDFAHLESPKTIYTDCGSEADTCCSQGDFVNCFVNLDKYVE